MPLADANLRDHAAGGGMVNLARGRRYGAFGGEVSEGVGCRTAEI
jgi:hypothetical protein